MLHWRVQHLQLTYCSKYREIITISVHIDRQTAHPFFVCLTSQDVRTVSNRPENWLVDDDQFTKTGFQGRWYCFLLKSAWGSERKPRLNTEHRNASPRGIRTLIDCKGKRTGVSVKCNLPFFEEVLHLPVYGNQSNRMAQRITLSR